MSNDILREFVFEDDRPFSSCHASTLLPLTDGRILATWFGGSHEKHPDVAIWLSTRDRGGHWSPPRRVADEDGLPHWNPVLSTDPEGGLHLFYKVGPSAQAWWTRVISSPDAGLTWSDPVEPPAADGFPVGPVKNKTIVLSDGTWIAPTSLEADGAWDSAVTWSTDCGATWELGGPVPIDHAAFTGAGVIQPTLWESVPGTVHMLLRSTASRVYRSDSTDGGRTWREVYATDVPNNNSGIDVVKTASGVLALCHNPVAESWGKRTPLVISFSRDNGETWGGTVTLEDEDPQTDEHRVKLDRAHRSNEFSYPAIVAVAGRLLVTYTWKRERICYRELAFHE